MNLDPWSQSTPQAGSKRPSPSPGDEDRESKKSRTQLNDCDLAALDCNSSRTISQVPGHNTTLFPSEAYYNNETQSGSSVWAESTNYAPAASLPEITQGLQENPWVGVQCLDGQSGLNGMSFPGEWHDDSTTQPNLYTSDSPPSNYVDYEHTSSPEIRIPLNKQLPSISRVIPERSQKLCIKESAPTLDTPFRADSYQHDLKIGGDSHSQADEQPLETLDAPPLPEAEECMGTRYEYDTCFGVIIETPTSSYMPESDSRSVPVHLKQSGTVIRLSDAVSGAYAGILSKATLVDALSRFHLRLDVMLLIKEIKKLCKKGKSKTSETKHGSAKPDFDYSIRIVLHGLSADKYSISDFLSKAGFFLQHPYGDEVKPGVPYNNPQYLLRPGAKFPLAVRAMDDTCSQTETDDDNPRQSQVSKLFDSAEADGQTVTATDVVLSRRLRSQLMSHQITALAMMHEKESGFVENPKFPPLWKKEWDQDGRVAYRHTVTRSREARPISAFGGIIADDMGLGKTLSILALICSSLDSKHTASVGNRGTLIVAPMSTICNWEIQARQHIHENKVRMALYHGPDRGSLASRFADFDVVITTYGTLRSEWAASEAARPIYSEKWLRIVLDEGKLTSHHIRNRASQTFQSVCKIDAQFRWCLTGTPIHNSLDDYGALLSFIQVDPFRSKSEFASWILQPVEKKDGLGVARLRTLIQATCLRRLKSHMPSSSKLDLPPLCKKIEEVCLLPEDKELYDSVKSVLAKTSRGIEEFQEIDILPKSKKSNVLVLINSLRLICDHGRLMSDEAKNDVLRDKSLPLYTNSARSFRTKCLTCGTDLGYGISQTAICNSCAGSEEEPSSTNSDQQNFLKPQSPNGKRAERTQYPYRPSAKIVALMKNLRQDREAAAGYGQAKKRLVCSHALRQDGYNFQHIDGRDNLEKRRIAFQEFSGNPECTVMLASIGCAAEGVNLVAASVVHLIEPQWNPMIEAQAVDRVHRIGQTQKVTVIRYIVPGSVETHIQNVQKRKMEINENANMDGMAGEAER